MKGQFVRFIPHERDLSFILSQTIAGTYLVASHQEQIKDLAAFTPVGREVEAYDLKGAQGCDGINLGSISLNQVFPLQEIHC